MRPEIRGFDPGDMPTERWLGHEFADGRVEYRASLGPSLNEMRQRWRKVGLEPRLLAILRRRLAQLEGG